MSNSESKRKWVPNALGHQLLGLLFERYVRVKLKSTGATERGRIFEVRPSSIVMNHAQGGVDIPLEDIDELRIAYEWPKGKPMHLVVRFHEGKWADVEEDEE